MKQKYILIFLIVVVFPCNQLLMGSAAEKTERIVTMVPALAEICSALGFQNQIVGVSDFCVFPPELKNKPHVGGLLNPSIEKIVSLNPNLVLMVPEQHWLAQKLWKLGINSVEIKLYTIDDIGNAFLKVGNLLGAQKRGKFLHEKFMEELKFYKHVNNDKTKLRFLIIAGRDSGELSNIYIAGPGTFLSQLATLAGGKNAYSGNVKYPSLSLEGIIECDPDVIFEIYPDKKLSVKVKNALLHDWNKLPYIKAVKKGRIYILDEPYIAIPGPRVLKTLKIFRKYLNKSD